jgi:arylsulfatase A-like enzyme
MTCRHPSLTSTRPRWAVVALAAFATGCECGRATRDVAPEGEARTLMLSVDVPFRELALPASSRPEGEAALPERVPVTGWKAGRDGGRADATAQLPVRTRNFYFFRPPVGMRLVRASNGAEILHESRAPRGGNGPSWSYDADTIRVHGWEGVPGDADLAIEFPDAAERERALNLALSGKAPEAFVRTSGQLGQDSRTGLLLPAPAKASWDVTIPPAADLRFDAALLRPEITVGPPSDGARVSVVLTVDGQTHELWSGDARRDRFEPVSVDLGAWARKQGVLEIRTDPGANARYDYVFLADPVIASRKSRPRRVVMVFVDTLRVDHVGTYGYERDTTPALDALAEDAVVFETARNVAPWTLPSARSVLTGRQPEFYDTADTIQGHLRRAGFATAMFAGNIYLSSNFGIQRDWGTHAVDLLPRANAQLDRALAWWEDHQGRDALLLVHLMDPHLPYKEPASYRDLFANEAPASLPNDEFHRDQVQRAGLKSKEERQYVRDRYDNNIRFADDQLRRLYDVLAPDDIVVFFSDHGEEFWDHGGFEHGHQLFDELLRVPLVVRAPGVAPRRVDAPVSLLDVVPTLLDLLGLPAGTTDGQSLVPLMQGDAAAAAAFAQRPQAFGRPLYGGERWGAMADDRKYMTFEGREQVFDLAADRLERVDLVQDDLAVATPMRAQMEAALHRTVVEAWRVAPRTQAQPPQDALLARVIVPGGVLDAWEGDDPTEASDATVTVAPSGDVVEIVWPSGYRGSRNVWIVPRAPMSSATPTLRVLAQEGDTCVALTPDPQRPASPQGDRVLIASAKVAQRTLEVGFGVVPRLAEGQGRLSGASASVTAELEAMGYVTRDLSKPTTAATPTATGAFQRCAPVSGVAAPPPGKGAPTERPAGPKGGED